MFSTSPIFNNQELKSAYMVPPPTAPVGIQKTTTKNRTKADRIKRPMNMFIVWCKEERKILKALHPEWHMTTISQCLSAKWKAMTPEEKAPYGAEADRLKQEHALEFPGYKFQPRKKEKKCSSSKTLKGPEGSIGLQEELWKPTKSDQGFPGAQVLENSQSQTPMRTKNEIQIAPGPQNPNPTMPQNIIQNHGIGHGYPFYYMPPPSLPPVALLMSKGDQIPLQGQTYSPLPYYYYSNPYQQAPRMWTPAPENVRSSSVGSSGQSSSSSTPGPSLDEPELSTNNLFQSDFKQEEVYRLETL